MNEQAAGEQQAVIATAIGAIIALVFGGESPSIWYIPISAILITLLLPYWRVIDPSRLHRLTYAFVFAFAILPALIWVLSPVLPLVLDGPKLTWWGVKDLELELFLIWLLCSGGIYYVR